jgi:hypothetical protein
LVLLPYLGDEVHAVPERGDEPNGGVPVEGHQLLLPHQPVDIPAAAVQVICKENMRGKHKKVLRCTSYFFSLNGQGHEMNIFLKV